MIFSAIYEMCSCEERTQISVTRCDIFHGNESLNCCGLNYEVVYFCVGVIIHQAANRIIPILVKVKVTQGQDMRAQRREVNLQL